MSEEVVGPGEARAPTAMMPVAKSTGAQDEEDEGFDEDIEGQGEPMMTSTSGPAADISGGLAVIHLM
jgi:hypothetical protein